MDPRAVLARVRALSARPEGPLSCCVAWSGGLDSTVLLHLLCAARSLAPRGLRLRAVHVDHGLQDAAAQFARHCRRIARQWQVPLTVVRVRVALDRGQSIEEQARLARYEALQGLLREGELLLTGQHADDQFETLLLAVLRGAGPAGLAGMPASIDFGRGCLLRPLLGHDRAQIARYAQRHALAWIDDPSNPDPRFDRNFLRLRVTPVLRERWPALALTGSRSARLCAQADASVGAQARRDVEAAADGAELDAAVVRRWPPARAAQALRAWIQGQAVRAPDERRLLEMLRMLDARPDAVPRVAWGDCEVWLQQGRLSLRPLAAAAATTATTALVMSWRWQDQPQLHWNGGRFALRAGTGDVDLARLPGELQLHGHAQLPALAGRTRRSLHKLFQELGVPAAARGGLPLVCAASADGLRLLAIADLWVDPAVRSSSTTLRRGRFVWRAAR